MCISIYMQNVSIGNKRTLLLSPSRTSGWPNGLFWAIFDKCGYFWKSFSRNNLFGYKLSFMAIFECSNYSQLLLYVNSLSLSHLFIYLLRQVLIVTFFTNCVFRIQNVCEGSTNWSSQVRIIKLAFNS